MKLAEALIARADLQRKIAQLRLRMKQNTKVQEGEIHAENVDALLRGWGRGDVGRAKRFVEFSGEFA